MGVFADEFWDEVIGQAVDMCDGIYLGVGNEGSYFLADYAVEAAMDYTGDAVEGHDFIADELVSECIDAHDGIEGALSETCEAVGMDIEDFVAAMEEIYEVLDETLP